MDNSLEGPAVILRLPMEILQEIISYLPEDKDIAHISYVCTILRASVTNTIWQKRCIAQFDPVTLDPASSLMIPQQYTNAYVARKALTQGTVQFNKKHEYPLRDVQKAVNTLKQVIVEARGGPLCFPSTTKVRSKNHKFLVEYLTRGRTDLLFELFRLRIKKASLPNKRATRQQNSQFLTERALEPLIRLRTATVQLLLSHLIIHPKLCMGAVTPQKFQESQWMVYQHHRNQPLFIKDALLAFSKAPGKQEIATTCPGSPIGTFILSQEGISTRPSPSSLPAISAYNSNLERLSMCGQDLGVNVDALLHIANFFRFHFKNELGILALSFSEKASSSQRIRPERYPKKEWDSCLIEEGCVTKPLHRHWIGTYTYLSGAQLERLREVPTCEQHDLWLPDSISELCKEYTGFQSIEFNFDPSTFTKEERSLDFAPYFSTPIGPQSAFPHPFPHSPVSLPKVLPFHGSITDGPSWRISGHLHCLPHQSENGGQIGGFSRINFIKYLKDEWDQVDEVYAYEGCVLPGRQMILGKWWSAAFGDEDWSGPFVMWVGEEKMDKDGD